MNTAANTKPASQSALHQLVTVAQVQDEIEKLQTSLDAKYDSLTEASPSEIEMLVRLHIRANQLWDLA